MSGSAQSSARGGRAPLSRQPAGHPLRLVSVEAGRMLAARLAAMGLLPGTRLNLVRQTGRGPVVVAVKGTRIALGRGMADKVIVAPWGPS